jgi:aminoglycoside phosphotransferase (APT) family kinase protein
VTDVVETADEARALARPPLLVLEPVRAFLDAHGLGSGGLTAARVGEGRSNFTFALARESGERYVLRRPPRPPFPPSAHDMVREARLQLALAGLGIRVPPVVAVCEDESVLGVPFYVMDFVDGDVITTRLPDGLDEPARARLGDDLVDLLAEIHAADVEDPALAPFRRGGDYLERQLRRFTELWPRNATRPIPVVDEVAARLAAERPAPVEPTVVHGDFRLGNTIVAGGRIVAALDWEMGAIGDPRADLGYLVATWSEHGGPPSLIGGSPATAAAGFPTKAELVERYARVSGRDVGDLGWFVALALWKAAIFCEAIYGRYVRGELASGDDAAAIFEQAVPLMAKAAAAALDRSAV